MIVSTEYDHIDNSTDTGSIIGKIYNRMSINEIENIPYNSVTYEEVARFFLKVGVDPQTRQSEDMCELMQELKDEKSGRRFYVTTRPPSDQLAPHQVVDSGLTVTSVIQVNQPDKLSLLVKHFNHLSLD